MENRYPKYEEMENQGATSKPPKKSKATPPADTRTELEKKVMGFYPQYNVNQIASMLMIPSHQVKEILNK